MNECRCIQNHLKSTHPGSDQSRDVARLFDHLLSKGKVGAALRLLTATCKGGVLPLDSLVPSGLDSSSSPLFKSTKEILQEKHPQGRLPLKILFLIQVWRLPVLIQFFLTYWMPV